MNINKIKGNFIMVKGTLFIDIDGTIVHSATGVPLPNVVEKINKAYDKGYFIILTTFRGDKNWDNLSLFSKDNSIQLLKIIELKYHEVVWDSPSPRIIINDDVCVAHQVKENEGWEAITI